MHQIPWFERKFDSSVPLELFPNVCARLRGGPARLEDVVRGRAAQALIRKPDGKWSAQEHAGHLVDLEPLWLARVRDYTKGAPELTPTDLANRKTDEARHNERPLPEILAGFRSHRERLMEQVQALAGSDAEVLSRAIPHPRLRTPFRLMDHLLFVAEHDDHHLAAIWDLITAGAA